MAPPAGGYPLELLITVRGHREEDARRAAQEAHRHVQRAEETLATARTRVNDFRLWRAEEESRRYAEILGKELDKKALDAFRAGLAALAEQEVQLEDAVRQATESLCAFQEVERQTAELLRQAVKDSIRIQEHRDLWREDDLRQAEQREEKELEP